jgi:hypothetical protein
MDVAGSVDVAITWICLALSPVTRDMFWYTVVLAIDMVISAAQMLQVQ